MYGDVAPIRFDLDSPPHSSHPATDTIPNSLGFPKLGKFLSMLDEHLLEREIARRLERYKSKGVSWHFESSKSLVPILAALYGSWVKDGLARGVQRLVLLSKGHGSLAHYALAESLGVVDEGIVEREFLSPGSPFQAHPEVGKSPLTMVSTGSLGQGLSIGAGLVLAARLSGVRREVAVVLGDGELDEGQVWEAASTASSMGLGELVAIIDRNGFQHTGPTESVKAKEPLADRWRSFGWTAVEVGPDARSIAAALRSGRVGGRPLAVIVRSSW